MVAGTIPSERGRSTSRRLSTTRCLVGKMKVSTTKTSLPVALGHLVDLRVGAALDEEGVLAAADALQPVEEVGDVLDLVVPDPLELHVAPDGALVAGPLGAERDDRDCGAGHPLRKIS